MDSTRYATEQSARRWTPGYKPCGPFTRWCYVDARLAWALDEALGTGCCEETGDVDGPGFYARVDFSHRAGGYIVRIDSQGFHYADRYETAETLDAEWCRIDADVTVFYGNNGEDDDEDEDEDACPECARSNGPHYSGPCDH